MIQYKQHCKYFLNNLTIHISVSSLYVHSFICCFCFFYCFSPNSPNRPSSAVNGKKSRVHPQPNNIYSDPEIVSPSAAANTDSAPPPYNETPQHEGDGTNSMSIHHNPAKSSQGLTANGIHSIPSRYHRSSVFRGTPDLNRVPSVADVEGGSRIDADAEEDATLAASAFHRQRSIITYEVSGHYFDLLIAVFNFMIHISTIITDLMLLDDYSNNGFNNAAAALAVIRIIVGLVEIEFDYLNRGWGGGRFLLIPLIFFNLRIVPDFIVYLRDWKKFHNKNWANSTFRATVSFETFIGSLPSLIVQVYVMIHDPRKQQDVWTVAFIFTSISTAIDLFHHYKYVHTQNSIYARQIAKALISTGMRTVLVAILCETVGYLLIPWIILSFLAGVCVYIGSVWYAKKVKRDNPFATGPIVSHTTFGGLVASTMLFVSIPFAPSHSIYDWWLGYLACEFKMAIENFIMCAIVVNQVYSQYKDRYRYDEGAFWSVFSFTLVCYLGNLIWLYFIHHDVRQQLKLRDIYSDTRIVKLFSHLFKYYRLTWHSESVDAYGQPKHHLLFQDNQGHVKPEYEKAHERELQRTQSMIQLERQKTIQKK